MLSFYKSSNKISDAFNISLREEKESVSWERNQRKQRNLFNFSKASNKISDAFNTSLREDQEKPSLERKQRNQRSIFNFSKASNKISDAFNTSLREEKQLSLLEQIQLEHSAGMKMTEEIKSNSRKRRNKRVACYHQSSQQCFQEVPTMKAIMVSNGYVDNHDGTTSLSKFIRESNVPTFQSDFVQQVVLGTMMALKKLHDSGVAHGSLTPNSIGINIDCDDLNRVTRVEARHIRLLYTENTSDLDIVEKGPASCTYASPQTLQGQKTDGRLDDMWAVGCILLEMRYGIPKGWESACTMMSHTVMSGRSSAAKRGIIKALYKAHMATALKRIRKTKVSCTSDFHLQHLLCHQLLLENAAHRARFASVSLEHPWFTFEYSTAMIA